MAAIKPFSAQVLVHAGHAVRWNMFAVVVNEIANRHKDSRRLLSRVYQKCRNRKEAPFVYLLQLILGHHRKLTHKTLTEHIISFFLFYYLIGDVWEIYSTYEITEIICHEKKFYFFMKSGTVISCNKSQKNVPGADIPITVSSYPLVIQKMQRSILNILSHSILWHI